MDDDKRTKNGDVDIDNILERAYILVNQNVRICLFS